MKGPNGVDGATGSAGSIGAPGMKGNTLNIQILMLMCSYKKNNITTYFSLTLL